jgi:nucleoid DNA-binding protein
MKLKKEIRNINKKEFILKVQKSTSLSLMQTEIGINGILEFLKNAFKLRCIIEIRGFGKFVCRNGKTRFKSFISF